jgi:hypothetical protein
VVEGARLESVCRGNSTVGSNPTLSAPFSSQFFLSISAEIVNTRMLSPSTDVVPKNPMIWQASDAPLP